MQSLRVNMAGNASLFTKRTTSSVNVQRVSVASTVKVK